MKQLLHRKPPKWVLVGLFLVLAIVGWMRWAWVGALHEEKSTNAMVTAIRSRQWDRVPKLLADGADPNADGDR